MPTSLPPSHGGSTLLDLCSTLARPGSTFARPWLDLARPLLGLARPCSTSARPGSTLLFNEPYAVMFSTCLNELPKSSQSLRISLKQQRPATICPKAGLSWICWSSAKVGLTHCPPKFFLAPFLSCQKSQRPGPSDFGATAEAVNPERGKNSKKPESRVEGH